MKKRSFIYRIFRKIFPKRAESFSDFIKVLRQERVISILAEPQLDVFTWTSNFHWSNDFPTFSFPADWAVTSSRYILKFKAVTLDGIVIYKEEILKQSETTSDSIEDSMRKRNINIMELISAGELRVENLKDEFPFREKRIEFVCQKLQRMNDMLGIAT
jgi:hypothetical protein